LCREHLIRKEDRGTHKAIGADKRVSDTKDGFNISQDFKVVGQKERDIMKEGNIVMKSIVKKRETLSRKTSLRLTERLWEAISTYADINGVSENKAMRLLIERGVFAESNALPDCRI